MTVTKRWVWRVPSRGAGLVLAAKNVVAAVGRRGWLIPALCLLFLLGACLPPARDRDAQVEDSGTDAGFAETDDAGMEAGMCTCTQPAQCIDSCGNKGMDAVSCSYKECDPQHNGNDTCGNLQQKCVGPYDGGTGECGCDPINGCLGPVNAGGWSVCPGGTVCDLANECVTPSYTINGDGTVTDNLTGVVWQQTVSPDVYEWADANAYCNNLNLAGTGWHLPTLSQLFSIEVQGGAVPYVDQTAFPNTPVDSYWTSTFYSDSTDYVWYDYFAAGGPYFGYITSSLFVRCAR